MADRVFDEGSNLVILQVMLCGEGELIAEVISKREYQKLFEGEKDNDQ